MASGNLRLYGSLAVSPEETVGCVLHVIRVHKEFDWFDLRIPIRMLELRFPVVYPLDEATKPWLVTVDCVLVCLAEAVYATTPFRLGLIGEEAAATGSASELTTEDCEHGKLLFPVNLWKKLKPNRNGKHLSSGLVYVSRAS
jgi:hypothetical protein